MKGIGNIKTGIVILLIILLILIPLSAFIIYKTDICNLRDDDNGNQYGEKTIKFDEIGHFELGNIRVIEVTDEFTWIGTLSGLYRYDPVTENLLKFNECNGLLSDFVNCIEVDNEIVWIGTNIGISLYDQSTNSWSNYTVENGLGGTTINEIIIENNDVWVAIRGNWQYTMGELPFGGLSCFNKKSKTWTVYNSSNGYLISLSAPLFQKADFFIFLT